MNKPTINKPTINKPTENCGFTTAIKMIEGKWKIDILCELGAASRRFGRLRQSIPAISEKMLAQQLRELEADGLVARKVYSESPAKVVYSLTERGATFNTSAGALCRWGEQLPPRADALMQPACTVAKVPVDATALDR
jgi:DNA-binding HxlR family transcriptional regulator